MNSSRHLLAFLFGVYMFKAGQLVYLQSRITGWFDRSVKHYIPEGTPGTVVRLLASSANIEDTVYVVEFGEEYGEFGVHHSKLRVSEK